jgi:hypothetical protein
MPAGIVTSRRSPADEGEEDLVDDGGDGVLVTGPEQELVAEQVDGKGRDARGDVVFYLAALGRSLEDGRHDLVSGLEGLLLVTVYTGDEERSRAIGVFTATLTAGGALGLVLGGVLTTTLGWRWCLYVNVAVSLIAIIGGPRVLPAVAGRREVRIDLMSAVLASAGMAALVYGLGEAGSAGWGSDAVAGSLAVAAVALAAFVIRQVGKPDRLLPLRVVADRDRGGALLAMIVNSLSTFGMLLILTYQLQTVMGYSALRTGLALIPFAIGTARPPVATSRSSSPPRSSKASGPASAGRRSSAPPSGACSPATPGPRRPLTAPPASSARPSAPRCSAPSPPPRPSPTSPPTRGRPP